GAYSLVAFSSSDSSHPTDLYAAILTCRPSHSDSASDALAFGILSAENSLALSHHPILRSPAPAFACRNRTLGNCLGMWTPRALALREEKASCQRKSQLPHFGGGISRALRWSCSHSPLGQQRLCVFCRSCSRNRSSFDREAMGALQNSAGSAGRF